MLLVVLINTITIRFIFELVKCGYLSSVFLVYVIMIFKKMYCLETHYLLQYDIKTTWLELDLRDREKTERKV